MLTTQQTGYLTIKQARRLFATNPSEWTIRWWMKTGMHNWRRSENPGERIKLKCRREGGVLLTTPEWVEEFITECSFNTKGGR